MEITIELTEGPIARPQAWGVPFTSETGSLVEFFGIVRETEDEAKISSLRYEAYATMAEKIMREKIALLGRDMRARRSGLSTDSASCRRGRARFTSGFNRSIGARAFFSSRNSWMSSKKTCRSGR